MKNDDGHSRQACHTQRQKRNSCKASDRDDQVSGCGREKKAVREVRQMPTRIFEPRCRRERTAVWEAGDAVSKQQSSLASVHFKVRVLRVLVYVSADRGADDVNLKVVLPCVLETAFRQSGCETQVPQLFRNFRVRQLQDVSRQSIFEIGNLAVLLDFKTSGLYFL
jgi:hypothetical protein